MEGIRVKCGHMVKTFAFAYTLQGPKITPNRAPEILTNHTIVSDAWEKEFARGGCDTYG